MATVEPVVTSTPSPSPSPSPASPSPEAPAPATTVTARSAVEAAFGRASGSTPDGDVTPPAEGVTPPPPAVDAGTGTPTPPAGDVGIANLRSAYDRLKSETAWVSQRQLTPEKVEKALAAMERWDALQSNPVAFYRQLGNELGGIPEMASQLAPPKEDPEPGPDVYSMVNGERVELYSAKQQKVWREWNDRQSDRKIQERLDPLTKWVDSARQEAERGTIYRESRGVAQSALAEARQLPHFKEGEQKISQILAAIPKDVKARVGAIGSLYLAYSQYLQAHVFPTIGNTAKTAVEADIARKAAAAAGNARPAGSGQTAGAAQRPTNVNELSAKLASGAYNR